VVVYNHNYPTETSGTKKRQRTIAIIPFEDLPILYKINEKAPRRPKNFPAALMWRGFYIHWGDTFSSILELSGKLRPERGILDNPPSGIYTVDEADRLFDNLTWILAFTKQKRERRHLYFVELTESGGNFRFSANRDCHDALDTSLYTLGQLIDELDRAGNTVMSKRVSTVYGRLLKLVD
jgi:hypothetical protein